MEIGNFGRILNGNRYPRFKLSRLIFTKMQDICESKSVRLHIWPCLHLPDCHITGITTESNQLIIWLN